MGKIVIWKAAPCFKLCVYFWRKGKPYSTEIDKHAIKMTGFKITTADNLEIKFEFYTDAAPATSKAFSQILPLTKIFYHARVSGQEIWIDNMPEPDIIQENASIFTEPGEAVVGPSNTARIKTAGCFGIYYGEGKGLDACNIFAKVIEADKHKLSELGNRIWKNGSQELTIDLIGNPE